MGVTESAVRQIVSPINNLIIHVLGSCDCTIASPNCNFHWRTVSQHDLNRLERADSQASLRTSITRNSNVDNNAEELID